MMDTPEGNMSSASRSTGLRHNLVPPPLVIQNSSHDTGPPITPDSARSRRDNCYFSPNNRMLSPCDQHLIACLRSISQIENLIKERILSRPILRKVDVLLMCKDSLSIDPEQRLRAVRSARSIGERAINELLIKHQDPHPSNLWTAVRSRGCQFLGPAMQEEVLKLVLLALEDGSALSRKVLVMFVVQRLQPHFPLQASKTAIGHVIQLLYRASCFKLTKREGDSSLMQLKEEFCNYEALRREHDTQIVSIAFEAGLRMSPDQWSSLLYGDSAHKSFFQSIIDKLQPSFENTIVEFMGALERTKDPGNLSHLKPHFDLLVLVDMTGAGSATSSDTSPIKSGPPMRSPHSFPSPSLQLSPIVYPSIEDTAMALNAAQVITFSLARFLDEFRGPTVFGGPSGSKGIKSISNNNPARSDFTAYPRPSGRLGETSVFKQTDINVHDCSIQSSSIKSMTLPRTNNQSQNHANGKSDVIPFPENPTVSKYGPISPVGSINTGTSVPSYFPQDQRQLAHQATSVSQPVTPKYKAPSSRINNNTLGQTSPNHQLRRLNVSDSGHLLTRQTTFPQQQQNQHQQGIPCIQPPPYPFINRFPTPNGI